ncbi:D-alanyl-D-alanine carboxypeptidase/D-alanyl-D-alanine-endopeptidase [Roseospira visakhapatnamensis]|uniref:D-alanyl-D-alanine carboxypeptidase/D-alanyl-D-alanine-endopeptidase (Penicillin-binding protein 4) n=1 Tax=Roseospira visakhapatnamensis TaxID=390880 RepID=A0A7W6RBU6_9PROT|nr:D-alanyl-D-alanine carboxypeptidase [Roseospira visakhapatnamensis]MBB4265567.1 D-alanyl-D-alanine carboxypeptidase/D-alanyl-D-alanine-endopeptidase (penicillin-binding protein 4) [Roseospira visakhapatnamensis]
MASGMMARAGVRKDRRGAGRWSRLPVLAVMLATIAGVVPASLAADPGPPPLKPHPSAIASILDIEPVPTAPVSGGATAPVRAPLSRDDIPQGDGGAVGDGAVSLAMRPVPGLPGPPALKPTPPRPDAATLIATAGFAPAQVGYLVVDLDTGEVVAEHNADRPAFLPASVAKVPTTVAALHVLGPDHRFNTALRFDGTRGADGTWRGTLALVGGGDPVLTSDALRGLVTQLKAAGLRRLDGTFVHDDSGLMRALSIDPAQPPEHSYNPGLSALSLDFNRVRVQWRGDRVSLVQTHGTPAVAPVAVGRDRAGGGWRRAGPWLRHDVVNQGGALTAAGDTVVERWRLSPLVSDRGARWLPVKAPAPFTASVFRALAGEAGVVLPPARPAGGVARGAVVARHDSPALSSIAARGLKYSNNMLAELVGLATARALDQRPRTLAESAAAMTAWYARVMPWVDWSGFVMTNHSGLSSISRASPAQIVAILRFAMEHPSGGRVRYDTLLPQRAFKAPATTARPVAYSVRAGSLVPSVWAKSGTMYHGRGLAGIALGGSGHRLAFAVFTSDLAARRAFDDGYLHYSGRAVARAKAALGRARDLEHALLLSWILAH